VAPLELPAGPLAEWQAKELLRASGVPVPSGRLAGNAEEAAAIAGELGYPVAVKAQSAALPIRATSTRSRSGWATPARSAERTIR
jgi:acyl-CoA synthetase (NDP forming)